VRRREKATVKACDRCAAKAERLYRVRIERGGPWVFVCDACWAGVREGNPHYAYGGTWTNRAR